MDNAYIALGGNIDGPAGSPHQTLETAITRLSELGIVVARSSFYETDPVGYAAQPRFVNAAAALRTELEPEELLAKLLEIERSLGRDRSHGIANGPRTLDLDLLLYGNRVIHTRALQLPHPRMAQRAFVLTPLAEIAPGTMHPTLNQTMSQLRDALGAIGTA